MPYQWYYAHGEQELGPFSQEQLKEMAALGTLLRTDTVWREGLEQCQGVAAHRIKNLFPQVSADIPQPEEMLVPAAEPAAPTVTATPEATPTPDVPAPEKAAPPRDKPRPPEKKRGRATALKGADIASQDGAYARYRKKCTTCGHLDSACHTLVITNKMFKTNFFCPKCRKSREVAIQCTVQ
jgi:hypothetical protein